MCLGKHATIVGSARSDGIVGTPFADVIAGGGGSDSLSGFDLYGGSGGRDRICGGAGNDFLDGWGDDGDLLDGGPGFDVCQGGRAVRCEDTRTVIDYDSGPLRPGSYAVDAFRPRFGFRVGEGWSLTFIPLPTQAMLARRPDPGGLTLTFDSFYSRRTVADTVSRLSKTRGVRLLSSSAAVIGGARGRRVDLLVTATAPVTVRGTDPYTLAPGSRTRAYGVRVAGETVVILVTAPAAEFTAFSAQAKALLDTVRWR